jgi:diguanylate cyclase (GGDEF)-like protein
VPTLDIFTLDVYTTLNVLVAGTALLVVSTLNKGTSGVRRCALSCLCFVFGFALYPARLIVAGQLIVLIPNLLVFAGMLVLLDGVQAFRGIRRRTGLFAAGTLVFVASLCFWTFVRDNINARTVVEMLAVVVCAICVTVAMAADVPYRDRRIYWSTAAPFALHGLVALVKACDAVWGPPIHFWVPRPVDVVFAGTLNVCIVGCAFGLSIAINLKLQRETEELALYDSLTQLPNRRLFEENLERAEQRAFETGQRIALVYCDLDDLKGINDTLGHAGGDMALRLVGDRLRRVVDENISLARIGGDEFLLLIENAWSRDKIHALIQRLRASVEGEIEFEGRSATVRISCGLAIYPDDVGSVSDLIRLADAAMYMMKQHGRSAPTRVA